MSAKTARNLGIRLDSILAARLERFEERTGVEGTTLGRKAIEAALDYFEINGQITFPLELVQPPSAKISDFAPKTQGLKAAEEPSKYSAKGK